MHARGFGKGGPLACIVGPNDELCAEYADDARAVADEALLYALEAIKEGREEAGANILQFAERLTLLAGGQR